ncbi:ribosomal protein S5 domain 2-type protein, partial [Thamnocephalis sphaerospora]
NSETGTDNRERQSEEYLALQAIYGEDAYQRDADYDAAWLFAPPARYPSCALRLRVHIPPDYPSHAAPVSELLAEQTGISISEQQRIIAELSGLYIEGEEVLFAWAQWLVDYVEDLDRKSIFVAHLAKVHSADDAKRVLDTLLMDRKIARATHNILAYRIVLSSGALLQDCDDDGETAAGGRLLHLLQIVDVQNVVVVVTRWYGGILLGPDRFKHINNAARSLLEQCGYIDEKPSSGSKKQ